MRDAWNAEIADSSIACAAAALLQRHVKAYPKTAHFDFKNCGDGKRIGEVLWNNGHLTISLRYQPIYMMVSWLCNEKTAHFGFKSDGGQQRHVSSYWIRQ